MNIGDALRFFRTKTKYTQKEMLPYHSDPSSYSRIENNKQGLKFDDLKSILNKLSLQHQEFFNLVSMNEVQQEYIDLFFYCGAHLENASKKKKLVNYYNTLKDIPNKSLREMSNYIAIKNYFHMHWEEIEDVTYEELTVVFNYLMTKKFYFHYDYVLISNLIIRFSPKQADLIISKTIPIAEEDKRDSTTKKYAYNSLINLITIRIYEKDYKTAEKYIQLAKKQDKSNTNYNYRMNLQYLNNLLLYLEKGEPMYMERIYDFIHILEDIGDFIHANAIKKEIKLLTHNNNDPTRADLYPVALIKED